MIEDDEGDEEKIFEILEGIEILCWFEKDGDEWVCKFGINKGGTLFSFSCSNCSIRDLKWEILLHFTL